MVTKRIFNNNKARIMVEHKGLLLMKVTNKRNKKKVLADLGKIFGEKFTLRKINKCDVAVSSNHRIAMDTVIKKEGESIEIMDYSEFLRFQLELEPDIVGFSGCPLSSTDFALVTDVRMEVDKKTAVDYARERTTSRVISPNSPVDASYKMPYNGFGVY